MAYTTIDKPDDYFNTVTYSGNGSTQSITGVGFQPDWVWVKARSGTYGTENHFVYDVIRGANVRLIPNGTTADATDTTGLSSFDSDGFSSGSKTEVNGSGTEYVSWNWLAGGTASSNTDGSITSSVSANTTAGFSIVTYSGTGSNATFGHGLNQALDMIIVKDRTNNVGNTNWNVYHSANTSAPETDVLALNATSATSDSNIYWNDTAPTSSVFSLGTAGQVNYSTDDYVAYCFHSVKGYSKFGSYTGNGNTDGTFVYTGFKPAFALIKRTTGTENWLIMDNKRIGFNNGNYFLEANTNSSEETSVPERIDFLSNGMKMNTTWTRVNASGAPYIYMAFAENPFVTSTGIPTTAR